MKYSPQQKGALTVGNWEVWYHSCGSQDMKLAEPFMAQAHAPGMTVVVSAWNAATLCQAIVHSDPATVKAVSALAPRRLSEGRTDAKF